MSGHEPDPVPAILAKARRDDTKPARKTRSDKGTKRRPRKKGGDNLEGAPGQLDRAAPEAVPGGPAEPGEANELADKDIGTHVRPESGYVVAGLAWLTEMVPSGATTFEQACALARKKLPASSGPLVVYLVAPKHILESSIRETRIGRVRKAKP